MKNTSFVLLTLVLVGFLLWIPSNMNLVNSEATFKISGYVLDPNGNGVSGAKITFARGTPFYPSAYTNNSGYYEVLPYTGFNDVSITPPSDSNFVKFSQSSFDVESNMTANFTLSKGYRLSGFVLDQNLNPIKSWLNGGVGIFLDSYWSGTWADSNGHYYVVAPAGIHKIYAKQLEQVVYSGIGLIAEYEVLNNTNLNLNDNVIGNIVINFPNSTSSPTILPTNTAISTPSTTISPYATQKPTLNPTYTPTIPELTYYTVPVVIMLGITTLIALFFKKIVRK
jgi:hypothetical protein